MRFSALIFHGIYLSFERCLNIIFTQHHIGVGGVEVGVGIECGFGAAFERIAEVAVLAYPIAQLEDGGLVGGEIDEAVAVEDVQHIKVVGEFPIHFISSSVGGEIGRVDEEHHAGYIFILLEELSVITGGNDESVEIVIGWWVANGFYPII